MSYGDGGYEDGGQSRGPGLRMIAGIVIALISVVIYMTRTEVNPVTGEKQHIAMNVDEEKAMGLQAALEIAGQMGGEADPATDRDARHVKIVGEELVKRTDASKSPYVGNYSFHLLNDNKTINAFALPGGPVFITRALYDKLTTEAELAGVLGHEIGHVVNRHAAEHMAEGELGQRLTMAFGVGASDSNDGGQKAAAIAAMLNQFTQLRFSRQDESEADHYGLKYMAEAGFDPNAMLKVMEILKAVSSGGGAQPEFMQTHPLPETRLVQIKEEIQKSYPDGIPSSLTQGRQLHQESVGQR